MTLRTLRTHPSVVALAAAAVGLAVAPGAAQQRIATGALGGGRPAFLDGSAHGGDQGRELTAEQTARETRTLALGPAGVLELRNLEGNILVTAAPGREVQVEIVRRSRGRTEGDAKLGLERVRAVIDHQGERAAVTVEPSPNRGLPYSVSVAYTVSAPAGTRIIASSLSGDVTIKGIKGEVTAFVNRGNINISGAGQVSNARSFSGDVTITDLDSDRGLVVNALSGDVLLQRIRARRVEVEATSGDVTLRDSTSDNVQLSSLAGSVEYSGSLTPRGRYQFQTHSGTIRMLLTSLTGLELQASTFRGSVRVDPSITLKGQGGRRGSVRGTVGDGAATVVATSFSGNIEVGRK